LRKQRQEPSRRLEEGNTTRNQPLEDVADASGMIGNKITPGDMALLRKKVSQSVENHA